MGKFFFHLRGGGLHFDDPVGTECRDVREARCFALQLVQDLAAVDETEHEYPPSTYVDVEDDQARPVFMLPLRASVSER